MLFLLNLQQASPQTTSSDSGGLKAINVSFKFDPGPTYGGPSWVSPATFSSPAQEGKEAVVEARVQGINDQGKQVKINPEWSASDPDMVAVSPIPGQDGQFRITAKRAGESKLKVAAQGISKELVVKVKSVNKGIALQVEITQPKAEAPAAVATNKAAATIEETPKFKSEKEKASYAVGMSMAAAIRKEAIDVDGDMVAPGVKESLAGGKTMLTEQQASAAVVNLQQSRQVTQVFEKRSTLILAAEKNQKEGAAFLAENQKKEGVVTLPSGLQYKVIKAGAGKKPALGDLVVCNYRGTFLDGTEFDSSFKRNQAATFAVRGVVKGWSEALQLMPEGSKWQIFIPSQLGYGIRGVKGHIGPNATLIFEVELVSVQSKAQTAVSQVGVEPQHQ